MLERILIVSHNSFSSYQNMGKTLNGLFHNIPKENINHLYFHDSYPDIDKCNSIFRITDFDVIKATKGFSNYCGSIVSNDMIDSRNKLFNSEKAKLNHLRKKKNKSIVIFREILWGLKSWDSKNLNKWIKLIKPQVIFFAAGDALFPYQIVSTIAKRFRIPVVTYFCDDYYFVNSNNEPLLFRFQRKLLKMYINKIINLSKKVVYISESLERAYKNEFNKSGMIIMTPYQNEIKEEKDMLNEILTLSYAGNVSLNRWRTLVSIGNAIQKINDKHGNKLLLNIYSGTENIEITNHLNIDNAMKFKGNVSSEELKKVMQESDVLVHVESFDASDIPIVKHSISTKIADYLSSSRLILAVGPGEIASIKYLNENNAAIIIDSPELIEKKLIDAFIYRSIKENVVIENARKLSIMNHSLEENSRKLYQTLDEVTTCY